MNCRAVVYLSPKLLEETEDTAVKQLADAASLPGAVDPVVGMPDMHQGYGLPIGGILAVEADTGRGVVSAGAVGYDINCGVRLLSTNIPLRELNKSRLERLVSEITARVPVGVGKGSPHQRLYQNHFRSLVEEGVPKAIELGFGRGEDAQAIEEGGCMQGADIEAVSSRARGRGDQLGTLGSGNHFIEISSIEEVYDSDKAERFGLEEGYAAVMVHSGSRGFGHQVCTDYSRDMKQAASGMGIHLPSGGLACAWLDSDLGRDYLKAMTCAVNYAFVNRQLMTDAVRKAFSEVMGENDRNLGLDLVYDVAHNIAKYEEHEGRRLLIHRKGATRALPAGHPDNPDTYRDTGHPALIPGSMGTSSYITVGTKKTAATYYSVNHGAGRTMSRTAAERRFSQADFQRQMEGIVYNLPFHKILDESPGAYKDINEVVAALSDIGMTQKVARVKPMAVAKGD